MADNIKKVIEDDGTIRYYLGDLHHNPDGPAIEYLDADYEYWQKGQRHNLQGPAKSIDGVVEYWIDGRQYANEVVYRSNIVGF